MFHHSIGVLASVLWGHFSKHVVSDPGFWSRRNWMHEHSSKEVAWSLPISDVQNLLSKWTFLSLYNLDSPADIVPSKDIKWAWWNGQKFAKIYLVLALTYKYQTFSGGFGHQISVGCRAARLTAWASYFSLHQVSSRFSSADEWFNRLYRLLAAVRFAPAFKGAKKGHAWRSFQLTIGKAALWFVGFPSSRKCRTATSPMDIISAICSLAGAVVFRHMGLTWATVLSRISFLCDTAWTGCQYTDLGKPYDLSAKYRTAHDMRQASSCCHPDLRSFLRSRSRFRFSRSFLAGWLKKRGGILPEVVSDHSIWFHLHYWLLFLHDAQISLIISAGFGCVLHHPP
jgi:hypothetical protein